jgi:hypothetical protein
MGKSIVHVWIFLFLKQNPHVILKKLVEYSQLLFQELDKKD